MADRYNIAWTREAKNQVDQILEYLNNNWSKNECDDFLDLLLHFENTIAQFPKSFKSSNKFKNCRLGFVHKHITAVYKLQKKTITILTVIDNRSNLEK